MLLVIDIGNTNIVAGLYEGDQLTYHWRLATDIHRTSDEYTILLREMLQGAGVDPSVIQHTVISSVVPPITPGFQRVVLKLTKQAPTLIDPEVPYGMPILLDNPKEIGADRLVNSIAGFQRCQTALVIVDFGTATTFDVVSENGEYLGGIITPGMKISLEALNTYTARLPRIEIEVPTSVIGKNTVHSMQSGILFGYAGMVDSLIEQISNELSSLPKVIATGGLAKLVHQVSKKIDIVFDDLTLWGLYTIYQKNFL